LQITDEGGKLLKSESALRIVPIHSTLITDGFLDFVDSIADMNAYLFGDVVTITKHISKWFNTKLMLEQEISSVDDTGHRRVLHSTRHTFITKALEGNIQAQLVQEVVGHEKSSTLGITARYTHRFALKELCKVVDAVKY